MNKVRWLASLLLAAATSATAAVTVSYGEPDRFTDAGDRNSDPRKVMRELADFMKKLGDRYVPAGTNLAIEVLDLDRAGRPRMNLPTEIRVMTGKADPPCMDLKYTLEAQGSPPRSARERVCDLDYLFGAGRGADQNDPLVYEKHMLDNWFRERFATPASSAAPARPPR
jgi:hypothetical protein